MSYSRVITRQLGAAVHQNSALNATGLLERMFSRMFEGLVYPQIWEDPVVDMTAMVGAKLVLPGPHLGGASIGRVQRDVLPDGPARVGHGG